MTMFEPDYVIEIAMDPVAKGRPRMGALGNVFTPKKTRDAEDAMRWMVASSLAKRSTPLFDGPLDVNVQFTFAAPKSLKRRSHTVRPDLDNLIKGLDALNGLVWVDDSQIQTIRATKHYGDRGMIRIQVWELCTREENENGGVATLSKNGGVI
jgi:Holliday junction resolvase RusA-like endonuclease